VHLAEINIGRLLAPPGDPRVAAFMEALARVNGLGKRMPGFVWMMEDAAGAPTGNTGSRIEGDPRFVFNLTVWDSLPALETFVWQTVHRQFYDRRAEWFEVLGTQHFAMWRVAPGHRPTLAEGLDRIARRNRDGDSADAFGWDWARAHPDRLPGVATGG
jgi:heme-degrading monooxygenase HmoA